VVDNGLQKRAHAELVPGIPADEKELGDGEHEKALVEIEAGRVDDGEEVGGKEVLAEEGEGDAVEDVEEEEEEDVEDTELGAGEAEVSARDEVGVAMAKAGCASAERDAQVLGVCIEAWAQVAVLFVVATICRLQGFQS
jgi:hypothetical protein